MRSGNHFVVLSLLAMVWSVAQTSTGADIASSGNTQGLTRPPFQLWQKDKYENTFRNDAPGKDCDPFGKIKVEMALGEFRDSVFMVTAADRDIRLEINVAFADQPTPDIVDIRATDYYWWRAGFRNDEYGDALIPLEGTLMIPQGQSRQVWLRFNARYYNVKPGKYPFSVQIRDLNTFAQEAIPGTLEVWDFRLPSYDTVPNNTYAALYKASQLADTPELMAQAAQHMKMYGANIVFLYPTENPRAVEVDDQGNVLRFDSTIFDHRIPAILKGWGSAPGNEKLLWEFSLSGFLHLGMSRDDITYPSEKWEKTFAQWLTRFKDMLRRHGIADDQWFMAMADEESEEALISRSIPLAEIIKSIDPAIKLTCNSSTIIKDPEMSARFLQAFDIFQPHFHAAETKSDLLPWLRSSGKQLWTYKCEGWSQRDLYDYYRVYGWQLQPYGISGTGIWTYCAQGTGPWGKTQRMQDYVLVFKHKEQEQVIHSRRYEFYREGVDDYRYLKTLMQYARQKGPQAEQQAEQLIQLAIADIVKNTDDTTRCDIWRSQIAQEILTLKPSD